MFTYRDFEMGTLGLAWTGDLKNAGGVCEKNGVRPKFILFIPYILINASSTTLLVGQMPAGVQLIVILQQQQQHTCHSQDVHSPCGRHCECGAINK